MNNHVAMPCDLNTKGAIYAGLKVTFSKASTNEAVRLSEWKHQTRSLAVTYEFSKDVSTFLIGVLSPSSLQINLWPFCSVEWGGHTTRAGGRRGRSASPKASFSSSATGQSSAFSDMNNVFLKKGEQRHLDASGLGVCEGSY